MKKILVLSNGNGMNRGNLALLWSTINTIREFVPDTQFVLMYRGSDGSYSDMDLQEQEMIGMIDPLKPIRTITSVLKLIDCLRIRYLNVGFLSVSSSSSFFEYVDSDLIVVIGGDTMSGNRGRFDLYTLNPFINIVYALILNKPVILYGESIGNYTNFFIGFAAKTIFNRSKLIIVRDPISKRYLDINVRNPNVYLTADSAYALDAAPKSRAHEILLEEGVSNNIQRPLIGINMSGYIGKYKKGHDKNKAEEYLVHTISRTIEQIIETLNAHIIMISHVYDPGSDDRIIINNIYTDIQNAYKSKVNVIKGIYSPQELKSIIGLCDLFIGARMHTTIASTSMLVPTIGIAYSHKMHGIIGEMLHQEKYIIDINELTSNKLIDILLDAWENKDEIKRELEIIVPEMKTKALSGGILVKHFVDNM